MGQHHISDGYSDSELRTFVRALLDDVRALERMVANGLIETGMRRIGAEQEMFIVDKGCRPLPVAGPLLARLPKGTHATTELAKFNLEINLSPQVLGGDCLSRMEAELIEQLDLVQEAANSLEARLMLVGILPTLAKTDLTLENMTPNPRFFRLNQIMKDLRGGDDFQTLIKGVDELQTTHDNVMLEACNTSFQIHFQVGADEFAKLYNVAQVVTAPVLAAAVNSPVLLQHRLWHETRVALFQQSLDVRSRTHQARGNRQRVSFGEDWVHESVLEIFREDIARFRVLISTDLGEPSMALLDRGITPPLTALCLHNGTVYRWNRACYGVKDNQAHLRIENRVLPAGPTVLDEVANAAFYFGLMSAVVEEYGDVRDVMNFDDAHSNFHAAARYGLQAQFRWIGGRSVTAQELILDHLLPLAREGLVVQQIAPADIDRYLGVIHERVESGRTGAQWMLDSLASMKAAGGARDARTRALTKAIWSRQETCRPVHTWELAQLTDSEDWRHSYQKIDQIMTTDLFTVGPEDLVDLAASLMDWRHLRHVPVEDSEGHLVGLLTHRAMLRLLVRGHQTNGAGVDPVAVREIMKPNPLTVSPETRTLEALELMREKRVSCLPVVDNGKLVGIVTEHDFIDVSRRLLEEALRSE